MLAGAGGAARSDRRAPAGDTSGRRCADRRHASRGGARARPAAALPTLLSRICSERSQSHRLQSSSPSSPTSWVTQRSGPASSRSRSSNSDRRPASLPMGRNGQRRRTHWGQLSSLRSDRRRRCRADGGHRRRCERPSGSRDFGCRQRAGPPSGGALPSGADFRRRGIGSSSRPARRARRESDCRLRPLRTRPPGPEPPPRHASWPCRRLQRASCSRIQVLSRGPLDRTVRARARSRRRRRHRGLYPNHRLGEGPWLTAGVLDGGAAACVLLSASRRAGRRRGRRSECARAPRPAWLSALRANNAREHRARAGQAGRRMRTFAQVGQVPAASGYIRYLQTRARVPRGSAAARMRSRTCSNVAASSGSGKSNTQHLAPGAPTPRHSSLQSAAGTRPARWLTTSSSAAAPLEHPARSAFRCAHSASSKRHLRDRAARAISRPTRALSEAARTCARVARARRGDATRRQARRCTRATPRSTRTRPYLRRGRGCRARP